MSPSEQDPVKKINHEMDWPLQLLGVIDGQGERELGVRLMPEISSRTAAPIRTRQSQSTRGSPGKPISIQARIYSIEKYARCHEETSVKKSEGPGMA